ncbi:type II toxin-antitoxin system VapC family toxin [Candidatus Fermentibacteria bacterium]|nr:type II toxin-antitoxin system VapC family toxin [Candidatus Fermentibacteria bacterium]
MIVLDTHAWVWWAASPEKLSPAAREAIDSEIARDGLRVSSISAWEVAMLVSRGRLVLTMDIAAWIARSEGVPFLRFVPVDNRIALRAVMLPEPAPRDPADRLIMATASVLGAPLVTADRKLRQAEGLSVIW